MGNHHRIVLDVGDAASRIEVLGDLVHVVLPGGVVGITVDEREAGPDVNELPHTGLYHQEGQSAAQELPVFERRIRYVRRDVQHPAGDFVVDVGVVLAAEVEVVQPRHVGRVDAIRIGVVVVAV